MSENAERVVPLTEPLSDIARSHLHEANRARRLAASISTPDIVDTLNSYADELERLAGVEDEYGRGGFGSGLYP